MKHKQANRVTILGISFFNGSPKKAVREIQKGGYMVVPAAPALVTMPRDSLYAEAVLESNLAIADSRYMTLLWLILQGKIVRRISGLTFLKEFLKLPELRALGALFLVNPSDCEAEANISYLKSKGISMGSDYSYTAPMYSENVQDKKLSGILGRLQPRYILLNIGGGQQEKLALYLRENLSYKPSIVCTGAAIAFLSGKQASIPPWVDRIGLGWLWRSLENPRKFVPRYLSAFSLAKLIFRYGALSPASCRDSK